LMRMIPERMSLENR